MQELSKPVSNDLEIEAQQALEAKDIAKVMAIKEKMDAEGEEISEKFAVSLVRFLLSRRDNESGSMASYSDCNAFF